MFAATTYNPSKYEYDVILARIYHYCAYQERCTRDVDNKLLQWKVSPVKITKIMSLLKEEGFIDEERFSRVFVRGKFHINKWGRSKIRYELKSRNIPEAFILKSMEEIGDDDYMRTIRELVIKKKLEINTGKNLNVREKIITFVTGKGFEFDLISKVLTELKI
ncbi:MAG: regulatory protein RecX [Bacteroidota bacterium]